VEPSPFKQAIREHLVLREQNKTLEERMPLARYISETTLTNESVFSSEADAVREERAMAAETEWPVAELNDVLFATDELWTRSPSFEWGD
jgi:hypothetical protein